MKPVKPGIVTEIIEKAKNIASGNAAAEAKKFAEYKQAHYKETKEGSLIRGLISEIRNYDLSQEKLAATLRVLSGDMPSIEDINSEDEVTLNVKTGSCKAETLLNLAEALRGFGKNVKTAAHVESFKQVRAFISVNRLDTLIN